ncbi:MAG: SpoIIIAH-like family protein [Oscillospiraceae bacterium]|nr:SpoIIIAH-like family protein [Oscillospiraceae bacterium]
MKIIKRNAIILAAILFVCVAVYLNWAYNRQEEALSEEPGRESLSVMAPGNERDLFYEAPAKAVSAASPVTEYFTSARLSRQQARDSAMNTLREASETETAATESVNGAIDAITTMAQRAVTEAEIEALVMAKGFDDCLVFLDEGSAIVAVSAPVSGLTFTAVSRITDIVLEKTPLTTEQIKIIEVK